jgi:anti-sigma factor RsiW
LRVEHLSPSQVIRFAAGELPADADAALARHVAGCDACRAQVAEQRALAAALGAWNVTPPITDLTARVLEELKRPALRPRPGLRIYRVLRVAAAVLLGLGLGCGAERLVLGSRSSAPPASPDAPVADLDYVLLATPDDVGLGTAYDMLDAGEGA